MLLKHGDHRFSSNKFIPPTAVSMAPMPSVIDNISMDDASETLIYIINSEVGP